MILVKLVKLLELFWKEMLHLKFKIMMKPYFHHYLTFLSRQQDNDDANDDENGIDIFSRTDKHRKYEMPQRNSLYTMSRSELWITVSHQLSTAILLLFISAAIGYFAKGSYLERWQQFSESQKTYQFSIPIQEELVKEWPLFRPFKFLNSQKARLYVLLWKQVTLSWQKICSDINCKNIRN